MTAIFKREMRAYFTSPLGYIFIGIFLLISGLAFSMFTLRAGSGSSLGTYYTCLLFALVILIPLLTMRSFAEERKQKTEQLLMTAPVTLPGMVFGKFLSAYCMFALTFLISCVNLLPYYKFSAETPNSASIIGNIIAILLVGAAITAIGLFISALTENQLVAALGTLLAAIVILLASFLNAYVPYAWLREIFNWISVYTRYTGFTQGLFDTSALLYYLSLSFIFLFLTVRVYEKRRWA